ncbi:MAG: hypothetical protein ACHQJ7_00810 [Vicinamibacteria bacterium]
MAASALNENVIVVLPFEPVVAFAVAVRPRGSRSSTLTVAPATAPPSRRTVVTTGTGIEPDHGRR